MTTDTTKQAKEKCTTSKKIILVSYIIGIVLTAILIFGSFKGYDMTTLGVITGTAYAEITASNAFYFWKAKKENVMKIAISCVKENPEHTADMVTVISALGGVI